MQTTLKNRTIFRRDNLEILRGMNDDSVDLIYLDPPFNKKKKFIAPIGTQAEGASFQDYFREEDMKKEWLGLIADEYPVMKNYIVGIGGIGSKSNKNYLCYMAIRLIELHRVLKNTGSLYLHCDPTMSHYLKILLDGIFGEKNFRNEIVWWYDTGGMSKRDFSRKHDIILRYSKSDDYIFHVDSGKTLKSEEQLKRLEYAKKQGEKSTYRLTSETKHPHDVLQIHAINPKAKERTGYPTQKPLQLLERIIKVSSNENDVVLDPFCGCATTCVAAERLERQWVGMDISKKAFDLVRQRLAHEIEGKDTLFYEGKVVYREDIPDRTDTGKKRSKTTDKHYLYGLQEGHCKGCGIHFNFSNLTKDHRVPRAKGGGDNIENLQLLCGNCNSIKGDRDMAFLHVRLRERKFL